MQKRIVWLLVWLLGLVAVADEAWTPEAWQRRDAVGLPEFGAAGYQFGERQLPRLERGDFPVAVTAFGAVADDGKDDTAAFAEALAKGGRIFVPVGRYQLSDKLQITRSGTVLSGPAGGGAELFFTKSLTELSPVPTKNAGGTPTTAYSWSGGLIEISGVQKKSLRTPLAEELPAGAWVLPLTRARRGFKAGDDVLLQLTSDQTGTLMREVYAGSPGDVSELLEKEQHVNIYRRVVAVDGKRIVLNAPIPISLQRQWQPTLARLRSSVTEVGLQHLRISFPATPYQGHFREKGYNAITIQDAGHCWVRNLQIHNADSGIFVRSHGITIADLRFTSERQPDSRRNSTGHHGVTLDNGNNLLLNMDFGTRFIHDLTVTNFSNGNVVAGGQAVDLCLDHHRKGPFSNLFTDIDAGEGSRLFLSGGGSRRGKHAGTRNVYWGIRTKRPQQLPKEDFGAVGGFFVGLQGDEPSRAGGRWWEPLPAGASLTPANLYEAQRAAKRSK